MSSFKIRTVQTRERHEKPMKSLEELAALEREPIDPLNASYWLAPDESYLRSFGPTKSFAKQPFKDIEILTTASENGRVTISYGLAIGLMHYVEVSTEMATKELPTRLMLLSKTTREGIRKDALRYGMVGILFTKQTLERRENQWVPTSVAYEKSAGPGTVKRTESLQPSW